MSARSILELGSGFAASLRTCSSRRWHRRLRPLGAAWAVAMVLGGCGDDGATATGDATSETDGGTSDGSSATTAGTTGTTGSGTDTDGPPDVTPPTFGGVIEATSLDENRVRLRWEPAVDDRSPAAQIAYSVYVGTRADAVNFAGPWVNTATGAAEVVVDALEPGTRYYFVVRATDAAGNAETNEVVLDALTLDTQPPEFAGARVVRAASGTELDVEWDSAIDKGTAPAQVVYRIFVADSPGGHDFTTPTLVSEPGAIAATVAGLDELTTYYVVVRAVDAAGNEDGNNLERNATTLDGSPPEFTGAISARATGDVVTLRWASAVDNGSTPDKIAYNIYWSNTRYGQNFFVPQLTTAPGRTTQVFTGLDLDTDYHFVVRAVDEAFNEDDNVVQVSATTALTADVVAPTVPSSVSATALSATTIELDWAASADDNAQASEIVYDLYYATAAAGLDFTAPSLSTAAGDTNEVIGNLVPETQYVFAVRARDPSGNQSGNGPEVVQATQPDTTPPSFAGITAAEPISPQEIRLSWAAATDDINVPSQIVYDVYRAAGAGTQDYSVVIGTSGPGATSLVIGGMLPEQSYFWAVRARDTKGNRDPNTVELEAATLADKTPPDFGGIRDFETVDETSLRATWAAASDNVSPTPAIFYSVYVAESGDDPDLAAPTIVTAPGATEALVAGLRPDTKYVAVVRATDEYGNQDTNTVEIQGQTRADTSAPTFAGASAVTGATATSLTVAWNAASDNITPAGSIAYDVCITQTASGCSGGNFSISRTVTGSLNTTFNGLQNLATYYFVVRARDEFGNRDGNSVVVSGQTVNDTTAPTFTGLASATALDDNSIRLQWAAANDNVSTAGQISYDVYRATTSGGQNFAAPTYTSAPGATQLDVDVPNHSTAYFFVVRARDAAGNRDTNTVQRSATTLADTTPPVGGAAMSASVASCSSVTLTFDDADDFFTPDSGLVYRICQSTSSTGCNGSSPPVSRTLTNQTGAASYATSFTGLSTGTTYYYRVWAEDALGNSNIAANTTVVSALPNDTTPPTWTTTTLTATAQYGAWSGRVFLDWNDASDTCYASNTIDWQVCGSSSSIDCDTFDVDATVNNTSQYTWSTGLASNTTYYFRVRPFDGSNNFGSVSTQRSALTGISWASQIATFMDDADKQCDGCHGWTPANTVNANAASGGSCGLSKIVVAGQPTNSVLYRRVTGTTCGVRMPTYTTGVTNLTGTQSDYIYDWIIQGAHNN